MLESITKQTKPRATRCRVLLAWRAEEGVAFEYASIVAKLYSSAFSELNSELNYVLFSQLFCDHFIHHYFGLSIQHLASSGWSFLPMGCRWKRWIILLVFS